MMERAFSTLMLASIVTLAAPMLAPQDDSRVAPMDFEALEARANAAVHDVAAFLEREGYHLATAQLMAAGGSEDVNPQLTWSPLSPPHPSGDPTVHAPLG
jgi:hypothetical protein